jgi:hypothetical protein
MLTRPQIFPLLLEACPSFHNVWGPLQRADEDKHIYVAFGAFAGHIRTLHSRNQTSEFSAVKNTIARFENEGDSEVLKLAAELTECIQSVFSGDHDA